MQNEQHEPFLDNSQLGELLGHADYEPQHAEPPVYDLALEQQDGTDEPVPKRRKNRQTLPRGGACGNAMARHRRAKLAPRLDDPWDNADRQAKIDCVYSQVKQRSRVRLLEDKLAELESRLNGGNGNTPASDETHAAIQHATGSTSVSHDSSNASPYQFLPQYPGSGQHDQGSFPIDPALQGFDEPHLMTLANAAEAAGEPPGTKRNKWDGLPVETLLAEVLKAVVGEPADTIGWAIINLAVDMHIHDRPERFQQMTLPLRSFLPRLAPGAVDRPHPALLLSIMYNYLPESNSPSLITLSQMLLVPAQNAQELGVANADRVLDLIRGGVLRTRRTICDAKFIQGWTDGGMTARLAVSAGLATINVGDIRYVQNKSVKSPAGPVSQKAYEMEQQLRILRARTAILPNAEDEEGLKERIDLFWMIWMLEKIAEICWGWRSSFSDDEVTTPWPRPHDEPLSVTPSGSLVDLHRGLPRPAGAPQDTYNTACLKALSVLQHASRLYDLPIGQDSVDSTRRLLLAITALDASLPADFMDPIVLPSGITHDQASKIRALKLTLLSNLKIATAFIYFKLDIDAPSTYHRDWALSALAHFSQGLEQIQEVDHIRFDLLIAGPWYAIGKAGIAYARFLEAQSDSSKATVVLRTLAHKIIDIFKLMSAHNAGSLPGVHLLENALQGDDTITGLTRRPDSMGNGV